MLSRSLDITNILYCTVPRGCRHAAAQAGWLTQGQSLQFSLNLQYTLKLKLLVEVVAQRFFGTDLRPWWTQHFKNATLALAAAEEQTELRRSRAQDPAVSSCSSPPRLLLMLLLPLPLPLPLLLRLLLLLLLLLRTPAYSYVLLRTPTYSTYSYVLLLLLLLLLQLQLLLLLVLLPSPKLWQLNHAEGLQPEAHGSVAEPGG